MKSKWIVAAAVGLGVVSQGLAHADTPITRKTLLKGCEIPARRAFPVNPKVNPCDNMYQYACSNVISGYKLKADRSSHTFSFDDSYERILFAKKKYLRLLAKRKPKDARQKMLKTVYNACMDVSDSKKEEKQIVGQLIGAVNAIKSRKQLMAVVASRIDEPKGAPLTSFVSLDSDPNQDNPEWRDAMFDSGLMVLPERSYYDNPKVLKDYEAVVTAFFQANHLPNAAKRAHAVVQWEKDFAHHYPTPVEFREREAERNPITRAQMLKQYPNLELAQILKKIPKRTKFRNLEPETFQFLNEQLASAPLATLKDVLLYQSAKDFMDDAYPGFFHKEFAFKRKNLGGPLKRPNRQERCTRMVMGNFGRELDAELLPILFPHFPEKKVIHLAETIRKSILRGLEHNKWLSKQGRAGAILKEKTAVLLLVKPQTKDQWDFTPPATYSPTERYANSILLSRNLIKKQIREYGEKRDRRRWLMGPLTINAYYMPMDNTFVLPQGILQYPFYDPKLPLKTNLAAIGSVIGHEMGHGIDDKGALYDNMGRLHMWMTASDLKAFKSRGARFVERFDSIGSNGKLELGENTADNVGLTFAYQAAFGLHPNKTTKDPKKLKAQERAFFTQYARAWCQVIRPKYREMLIKTDPHAMGDARVNEQVEEQRGFQDAFSCKPGDKLYLPPADRIVIW